MIIQFIIKIICKFYYSVIKIFFIWIGKTLAWLWSYSWIRLVTLAGLLAAFLTIRESSIGLFFFNTQNYNTITFTQPCKITNIFEKDVKTKINLLKQNI